MSGFTPSQSEHSLLKHELNRQPNPALPIARRLSSKHQHPSGPGKASLDFVDDKEDVVLLAQLGALGKVSIVRDEDTVDGRNKQSAQAARDGIQCEKDLTPPLPGSAQQGMQQSLFHALPELPRGPLGGCI